MLSDPSSVVSSPAASYMSRIASVSHCVICSGAKYLPFSSTSTL